MKNILLVGNWPSDTGYAWWLMERFWIAIARHYKTSERRIFVSFPQVREVNPDFAAAGIEVVEFTFDLSHPDRIKSLIEQHKIGCVYLTDQKYLSPTYRAMRKAGVEIIIVHDHTPGERTTASGPRRWLKSFMGRIPGLGADAYIAVSPPVFERFLNAACLPRHKCFLATNGIDIEKFHESPAVDIRRELGLTMEAKLVVSVGRASQYKGIQRIIEAASIVREKSTQPVHFIHCGDGPDLGFFNDLIAKRRLQDRFLMLGKRSDVAGILKSCDIAAHASEGEGLSLAILEFMEAELPVVLPDSPTVSQSVQDRVSGLLYRRGSVEDLAAKLLELLESPSLRKSMGSAAQRAVHEKYDLNGTIRDLIGVFEKLRI